MAKTPSNPPRIRLRDLATAAGVSTAAVSLALRGSPEVSLALREKVQRLAAEMGYRPDPGLSALADYRRKLRPRGDGWVIAFLVEGAKAGQWKQYRHFRDFFAGAEDEAQRRGYRLEPYWLDPRLSVERHGQILHNRGITGVLVGALEGADRALELDWTAFPAVALGDALTVPALCRASDDHFRGMQRVCRELHQRGVRRPHLLLRRVSHDRDGHRWLAAYLTEWTLLGSVPQYRLIEEGDTEAELIQWLRSGKADALVGTSDLFSAKLRAALPDTILASLFLDDATDGVGLRQNLVEVGRQGMALLDQLVRNHVRGVPEFPQTVLLDAVWVDARDAASKSPRT